MDESPWLRVTSFELRWVRYGVRDSVHCEVRVETEETVEYQYRFRATVLCEVRVETEERVEHKLRRNVFCMRYALRPKKQLNIC